MAMKQNLYPQLFKAALLWLLFAASPAAIWRNCAASQGGNITKGIPVDEKAGERVTGSVL
jgi:hypothetical protein